MSPVSDVVKSKRSQQQADARRDRWREHRAQRRADFVEAAVNAIEAHGVDVGMDEIASEAGVTKPVLYRHFSDKAELYLAVSQWGTELLLRRLIPAINEELAPMLRIRTALDAFFGLIEEHPNVYRFISRRQIAGTGVDSDPVAEDKELIAATIARLLGDYMRALDMDSGAAEPWAYGLVGLVQNTGEWWLARQSMSRDAVVEYVAKLIWLAIDGVLRDSGVAIDPSQPFEVN
ncbi:MAG: TetR/AcrR family transcriptional regulator, partial [Sciscionella sp.]|nr:TetR/AcrR family transcriptional regulator [Sciscionella sp.]